MSRYTINGFSSYAEIDDFARLIEFAQSGQVISGWLAPDDEEQADSDEWLEDTPIYDARDRSGHHRYPLAEALASSGCYDYSVRDGAPPSLIVQLPAAQDAVLFPASAETDLGCLPQSD